jgi:hypothetical protein
MSINQHEHIAGRPRNYISRKKFHRARHRITKDSVGVYELLAKHRRWTVNMIELADDDPRPSGAFVTSGAGGFHLNIAVHKGAE